MRNGAILLVLLSLVLMACRASGAEPTVPAGQPEATPAQTPFPVTVASDTGPVDIEDQPVRVVSLSATATEMLFAVGAGDQVVATDLTSNYPEAASATGKLDAFNFSVEEVAAFNPDLVILAFDFQGETAALDALDIPFLVLGPPVDLEAAFAQLETIGRATGHGPAAGTLAGTLEAEVAEYSVSSTS